MHINNLTPGSHFIIMGLEDLGEYVLISLSLGSARVQNTATTERSFETRGGELVTIRSKADATNISTATDVMSLGAP